MNKPPSKCPIQGSIDTTPYGRLLAERVADYLLEQKKIAYNHRDYCGMGLFYREGKFLYGQVCDGDLGDWRGGSASVAAFPDREAFITWLSQQSDDSLYGHEEQDCFFRGNQRITRARLEGELATHALVTVLAKTEFAVRFYQICARFPPRDGRRDRCTEQDVLAVLAELGRVPITYTWQTEPWPCPEFNFTWSAGAWRGCSTIYLLNLESVDFWCYFDRQGIRAGDRLNVLAQKALGGGGSPIPSWPYPEPVYHSASELREVLTELFVLQDLVSAVVADQEWYKTQERKAANQPKR
jgi:hypothetical protein